MSASISLRLHRGRQSDPCLWPGDRTLGRVFGLEIGLWDDFAFSCCSMKVAVIMGSQHILSQNGEAVEKVDMVEPLCAGLEARVAADVVVVLLYM